MTRTRKPAKLSEVDQLRDQITKLTEANAIQSNWLASARAASQPMQGTTVTSLSVGIRNISNNTLGFPDSPVAGEPAARLHAQHRDAFVPDTTAIVSYAYWLKLRKHPWYGRGLFVRDDSILGPMNNAAPADREEDLAPGYKHNQILDPKRWIESRTDKEIKRDMALITSEDSLRRIAYECDKYIEDARAANKAAEEMTDKERRIALETEAAEALPSLYRYAEALVDIRIADLYKALDAVPRPESGKGLLVTVRGVS